jgi:hypothetical protein
MSPEERAQAQAEVPTYLDHVVFPSGMYVC